MNLNNDDFYKTLKEQLDKLPEAEPAQSDWESFSEFSKKNKAKKKSILWYLIPVGLLFSFSLMGYFFLDQTEIKTNNVTETSNVTGNGYLNKNTPDVTKMKPATTQIKLSKKLIVANKKSKKQEEETAFLTTKNMLSTTSSIENTIEKLIPKNDFTNASISNEPQLFFENNFYTPSVLIFPKGVHSLKLKQFYAVPKPLTFGSNQKVKRPQHADWISAWGFPIITYDNSNTINYGAGIQLGKDFGKGWFLAAGVEYSQRNNLHNQNWKHAFESHDLIRIDTNLRLDASLNRIIMVMDSVYDYRKHEETVSRKTYINSRNIDIPIELGYQLGIGKFIFGSTIGIYNRIQHTQTNQIEAYPLSKNDKSVYSEKYTFQLLSSLGLSAAYPINKRLWVQAAPNLLFNPFERRTTNSETRFRFGIKYYLN